MKGKYILAFLAPLALVILILYYYAFTTLSTPGDRFKESAAEREDSLNFTVQSLRNPGPREVGNGLTEEITYMINASSLEEWVYFDFSQGSAVNVPEKSSFGWDLGFRRVSIISNGGETNPKGMGGIIELPGRDFKSIVEAPESGYTIDTRIGPVETENQAIKKWYSYSYWTHVLKPKDSVYIIRTADGRYAKMNILNFYCGRLAGCYTIRYVYQGNGSRKFY